MIKERKSKRIPDCHPERIHAGHGMCYQCYHHKWNKDHRTGKEIPEFRHRVRINRLRCTYGLSEVDYIKLFTSQNSKCVICKKELKIFTKDTHVDHDHLTDKVRGILCSRCNLMLGHAKDNVEILKAAIGYLE